MNNNPLIGVTSLLNTLGGLNVTASVRPQTRSAIFDFELSDFGTIFWASYPTAEAQRSKADILAGTGALSFGSFETFVSGTHSLQADSLIQSTAYKIHYYFSRTSDSVESDAEMTPEFTTTDQVNLVKDVALYLDGGNDASMDNVNKIWTNISNVSGDWGQTVVANQPVLDTVNNRVDFDGNDFLNGPDTYLNSDGFNIWIVVDRNNVSNHNITSYNGSEGLFTGILITTSTVQLINLGSPSNVIFSYAVGDALAMFRIEYDGNTTYNIYNENNVLQNTQVGVDLSFAQVFNRLAADTFGGGGLNGSLYCFCLYNGTESSLVTYIQAKLKAKHFDQLQTETTASIGTIPTDLLYLWGDSMAVGRDAVTNITGGDTYLNAVLTRSFVIDRDQVTGLDSFYNPSLLYFGENSATHFGPELSFLDRIKRNQLSYGCVVKYGIGGSFLDDTGASTDWLPSLLNESYFNGRRLSQYSLQQIKANFYAVNRERLALLLGTNDASVLASANEFGINLDAFKTQFRTDFGAAIEILMYTITSETFASTVNTALSDRDKASGQPESDANFTYRTVNSGYTQIDGVHYNADGLVSQGRDMYDNWFIV